MIFDNVLDRSFEGLVIKATFIITRRYRPKQDMFHFEHLFGKVKVLFDTFIYCLNIRWTFSSVHTIPSRPSIIAIRPPVLVPPMRSKYSHGLGASDIPI